MNVSGKIEDAIIEIIQRYCLTDKDKEEAQKYFKDVFVNDLIDDALED